MARRIALVSGAGGFIGRWSVPRLMALGYAVHAVVGRTARHEIPPPLLGATLHRADLLDPAATDALLKLVKPSHLLHFAWIATPGLYGTSLQNYRWLTAGERLLTSFYAAGGVRAVMAGSSAEYDWARCGVCDEYNSPLAGEGAARAAGAAAVTAGATGRSSVPRERAGTAGSTAGATGRSGVPRERAGTAGSTAGATGGPGVSGGMMGGGGRAGAAAKAGAPDDAAAVGAAGSLASLGTAAFTTRSATPYAECKIAMQKALARFGKVHGMSTAWGRIFFQFGPHEHPDRLVAHVIISLLGGRNALCSHGRQIRSFLHVADVGGAFAALLDSDVEGPVNIGSDERISLAELVGQVGSQIGRPDLLRLGARSTSPSEPALLVPEVQRLYTEVGWRPEFTLSAGIADTIAWWRAKLAGDGGGVAAPR